jgi:hypothetical protein
MVIIAGNFSLNFGHISGVKLESCILEMSHIKAFEFSRAYNRILEVNVMNNPVFLGINQNFIAEQIGRAEKYIFLAIPGITKKISDALIKTHNRLGGWEKISVVIDPSSKVYYLGYAELDAFDELVLCGCKIKCENNLRIGLLTVDDQMFVFSPLSLNLESDEEGADSVNALMIDYKIAQPIIEAIMSGKDINEPEIGKRNISEIEVRIVKNTVKYNPPQKPDLTRKISVLTSQFQFVNLSFKGSRLKNTTITLNARELGIVDEDLANRISGQYRVFEELPESYERGIRDLKDRYKRIKERFTRTIGEHGTIVWVSQRTDFENELKALQSEINKFNKEVVREVVDEANRSKERLKKFINKNYKKTNEQESFDQILAQIKRESVVDEIIEKAFAHYTEKELEKNLELKYQYYNISPQTVSNEEFAGKIEEVLGISLDKLVKQEIAFGVDKKTDESSLI